MTPAEVVIALAHQRGVDLWTEDGRVRYRAPIGVKVDDIKTLASVCRPALRDLLPDHSSCAHCGRREVIMVGMEPGADGQPWRMCGQCWSGREQH